VREFYSTLPRPVRAGLEATGSMQWFVELMEDLGIECLVGHPAEIRAAEARKQKHDRRDAGLLLSLLVGRAFSGDLVIYERTVRPAGLIAAPSSVGAHADPNTKCAAGNCLSQWSPTRLLSMDSSRPIRDRVSAVVTTCRLSAE
jgi:hypothetical protein